VWKEVQNVKWESRAHFTALVGSTTTEGIPARLFKAEKELWLGRKVLLPGEVEQPRKRLLSTPYGLMVERVARLVIPSDGSSRQQDHSRPAKTRVK
jgi:hypothetical protein